jgi:hypothetical protein
MPVQSTPKADGTGVAVTRRRVPAPAQEIRLLHVTVLDLE